MRLIKPGSSQSGDDEINPEWSVGQSDNMGPWIAGAEGKGSEKQEVPKEVRCQLLHGLCRASLPLGVSLRVPAHTSGSHRRKEDGGKKARQMGQSSKGE